MALPLLTLAVPVGTALLDLFMMVFRYAVVQWLTKAAIFALISLGVYFVAALVIPDWFSVSTLHQKITSFSPPIAYFLRVTSFYQGVVFFFGALIGAWVFKKIPGWAWLGALFRLK